MLHLYRCVVPTAHRFLWEHEYCGEDHGFCESPWLSVYHPSLLHVPPSPSCKAPVYKVPNMASIFTGHCCILWEFIFCPPMKADAGTKLVSVFSWPHRKSLLNYLYFWLGGWRNEKGYIFFLSVFFYAAHCSNHCLYFPIVSTEYGVDMKIL